MRSGTLRLSPAKPRPASNACAMSRRLSAEPRRSLAPEFRAGSRWKRWGSTAMPHMFHRKEASLQVLNMESSWRLTSNHPQRVQSERRRTDSQGSSAEVRITRKQCWPCDVKGSQNTSPAFQGILERMAGKLPLEKWMHIEAFFEFLCWHGVFQILSTVGTLRVVTWI